MRTTKYTANAAISASLGLLAVFISGCGISQTGAVNTATNPFVLQGQVLAGRNYLVGATINIYETQPNGVASNGSYAGQAKLLATTTSNPITGSWTVPNLSCASPDQLYVTAQAGVPYPAGLAFTSLANNPNSLLMTAIGDCSLITSTNALTSNVLSVVTNEASTVAAVTALRPFISLSGTTVNVTSSTTNYGGTNGSGVPGNYAGLAHAFLNANNLAPSKSGAFEQYTQFGTGVLSGGLIPVQLLNTLAYVQYLCTIGGSTGAGDFNYCTQLYTLATPPGGVAPTTSLQAMLNIANNPANNAAAIVAFAQTPIPYTVPQQIGPQAYTNGVYVPSLNAFSSGTLVTSDLSVAIYYGAGYGGTTTAACPTTPVTYTCTGQGSAYPYFVSIDANDNAFFSNQSASTSTAGNVIALKSNGVPLWTSANDTTGLIQVRDIAADQHSHVWVASNGTTATQSFVQEMDAGSGTTLQRFPSSSFSLYGVAVDSAGDVWYDSLTTTGQNLHELALTGATYAESTFPVPPAVPTSQLAQIRPDPNNNIWVAGYGSSTAQAIFFPNTGTATAPTYTSGVKIASLTGTTPYGITTDGTGDAYINTNGTGSELAKVTMTGSGAATTLSSTKAAANPGTSDRFMDTDGMGNIWFPDNASGTSIYRFSPSAGTTNAYYPCFNAGANTGGYNLAGTVTNGTVTVTPGTQYCATGITTRTDLAIDATGSIWIPSSTTSRLVQIIGLAAPTAPLRALGKAAVMP